MKPKPKLTPAEKLDAQAALMARDGLWREAVSLLLRATRSKGQSVAQNTRRWLQIVAWQRSGDEAQDAILVLHGALAELDKHDAATVKKERIALLTVLLEIAVEGQRWENCVAVSRALLDVAPRNHFALEALATAQLHSGQIDESAQTMRILLQLSPRDPLHRLKYATLLQLQDKSGESLREFSRVASVFPDAPFAEDARDAIELLDTMQIQQVLMRASEQTLFRLELQRDFDETLKNYGFTLSDAGRESLRHIVLDGRPTTPDPSPRVH